jgi:hypothetical protein
MMASFPRLNIARGATHNDTSRKPAERERLHPHGCDGKSNDVLIVFIDFAPQRIM